MWLARKRRSWQMLLPHIGLLPAGTYWARNSITRASASASDTSLALTRSIRPLLPWVPLFQLSMPSSTASVWWMANTGPSTRMASVGSVTTTAISMMRSLSGFRPVISRSIHTRFCSLLRSAGVSGVTVVASLMVFPSGSTRHCPATYTAGHDRLDLRRQRHRAVLCLPARLHPGQLLAHGAADPPRGVAPRPRARALRRPHRPGRPPQGRRLHHRQGALFAAGRGLQRGAAAGLDPAGRAGRAERRGARRPAAALGRAGLPAGAVRRLRPDQQPAGPAPGLVAHLPPRAAPRLQPHHPWPVAVGPCQGPAAVGRHRPAPAGGGAVGDGRLGRLVLAVGLVPVDGLRAADAAGLPGVDRPAVQPVQAPGRRRPGRACAGPDAALGLR